MIKSNLACIPCSGADGALFVPAQIAALFDAERIFLDSSAVKERTFIPVVGEIPVCVLFSKELHGPVECSRACMHEQLAVFGSSSRVCSSVLVCTSASIQSVGCGYS